MADMYNNNWYDDDFQKSTEPQSETTNLLITKAT